VEGSERGVGVVELRLASQQQEICNMERLKKMMGWAGAGWVAMMLAAACGSETSDPTIDPGDPDREPEPNKIVNAFALEQIQTAAKKLHEGARTDEAILKHSELQATIGRKIDIATVSAVELGDGVMVWEEGAIVDSARYTRYSFDDAASGSNTSGEVLELAFESHMDPNVVDQGEGNDANVGDQLEGGPGMLTASWSGGTRLQNTCQTWTVSGCSVTSCYQLFKPTNDNYSQRDYYSYNRYVTAVGRQGVLNTYPVVVDGRSRPHVNYASRVVGLSGYFPTSGSQLCSEGTSVGITLGTLSLGIGLRNCGDKSPIPNATTKTMGVIYDDGFIFGGPLSKGVDFEMEIYGWQGGSTPIMGDRNYGKFCTGTLASCTGTLGTDGW
jgi:hypothetical protein